MSEQSTSLTPQQSFEESIKERLRDDIGKFMPDDVLKGLVDKAIQDLFFKRYKETSGYHSVEEPSWFEKHLGDLLKVEVTKIFQDYIEQNKVKLANAAGECLASALPAIIGGIFVNLLSQHSYNLQNSLGDVVTNALRSKGIIQ